MPAGLFFYVPLPDCCGVDFPGKGQGKWNSFPGEEDEAMQVTKITTPLAEVTVPEHRYTQEQLQKEFNYIRAEKATKKMLEKGLITVDEFNKIMAENKRIFSPYLAAIL